MRNFSSFGQCYPNSGNKIMDIHGYGPLTVAVQQWDDVDYLLAALIQDANHRFVTILPSYVGVTLQETAQSGDTLFNGDGATLVYPAIVGAAGDLGNSFAAPVVPGTLTVVDSASVAPNLQDINADGILYTVDALEAAGTIDYENGYLNLAYPTGHAPGTGATAINAVFRSGTWITAYGNHLLTFGGQPIRDQLIRLIGLAKASTTAAARVRIDAVFGW